MKFQESSGFGAKLQSGLEGPVTCLELSESEMLTS